VLSRKKKMECGPWGILRNDIKGNGHLTVSRARNGPASSFIPGANLQLIILFGSSPSPLVNHLILKPLGNIASEFT